MTRANENLSHHPKARTYREDPADYFSVCTTCFGLTSLGQNYQHCDCEPKPSIPRPNVDCPNGYNLCLLCAREIAGGITRWSWLACRTCVEVAKGRKVNGVGIPLGRHSIMNGYVWPVKGLSDARKEEISAELVKFLDGNSSLVEFGVLQGRRLLLSEPELIGLRFVPLQVWRELFPTSEEVSKASVKEYGRWVREKA